MTNMNLTENNNLEIEDTQKDRYLTFKTASEDYGIEIKYVVEIIGLYKITPIPESPNYVKGVINLRGKVIPVIDIRTRFGLEFKEYDEKTCIIVVNINNLIIGIIVDTINEVVLIPEKNVDSTRSFVNENRSRFITGLGKINDSIVVLLDIMKILSNEELNELNNASN